MKIDHQHVKCLSLTLQRRCAHRSAAPGRIPGRSREMRNPRYAEGALLGWFRHAHTDINGTWGKPMLRQSYIARYCE